MSLEYYTIELVNRQLDTAVLVPSMGMFTHFGEAAEKCNKYNRNHRVDSYYRVAAVHVTKPETPSKYFQESVRLEEQALLDA